MENSIKVDCAHDAMVDVATLVENPRNANKHPEKQIKLLSKIIKHRGQRAPIVVSNRSGFIVKGHGRLMAIKSLGWEKAAVDYQDYPDEATEFADMIADNKIAELAEHDDVSMMESISVLGIDDLELLGLDNFITELKEIENKSGELDLDSFDNFQHECPKCGFEWNDNGTT